MTLSLTVAVLTAAILGADVAQLAHFTNAGIPAIAAVVCCVALPALADWRVTRAFRRLEPGAKSTFFQTLVIFNVFWLALLVGLVPRFTRAALDEHGAWMVPGGSAKIQSFASRLGSFIPRSGRGEARASAAPVLSASPRPTVERTAAPPRDAGRDALAVPDAAVPAIREAENVPDDTPAGRVYRERVDSVVVIHSRSPLAKGSIFARIYDELGIETVEALGSGFAVDQNGLVVTNHHVVAGAASVRISVRDGRHFDDVTLLIDDVRNDLALFEVRASDLHAVPLSNAKQVAVGARAIAIGCPFGLEYTLTEGIVSAHRSIDGTRFIQMQTSIAPGSSGGPLFDVAGSLIGVNTAAHGENMNLAVDAAEVRALLAAPRRPVALAHFEPGPRVSEVEAEGGNLDPTSRLTLREAAGLLAQVSQKCVHSLPAAATVTRLLPKGRAFSVRGRTESNLAPEEVACMSTSLELVSMQVAAQLARLDGKDAPRSLSIHVADLAPMSADAGRAPPGELVFRFVTEALSQPGAGADGG